MSVWNTKYWIKKSEAVMDRVLHQLVIPWFILGKLVLNTILDFLFVIQKFIIKQE